MPHLNEEELVAHYYHDEDGRPDAVDHLRECAECRAQFETLRGVLSLVNAAPVPDRGEDYGEQVWNRLRWKLGSDRRRVPWAAFAGIAAALVMAFFAGLLWRSRPESHPVTATVASAPAQAVQQAAAAAYTGAEDADRVLLYVVTDHLETSERVLLEVANAASDRSFDNSHQLERTEELVSANRLYRQTALQKGDERLAALLSDLEPVLIDLSHAGTTIATDELRSFQRRIESRGLLFKVRVISAQTGGGEETAAPPDGTHRL